jgi:hypothetical protein
MVHDRLAAFDAEASLDLASLVLDVRARNRYYRLYPRFVVFQADRVLYTPRPTKEMRGFAGWLPYVNKRWPIGSGKFAFKDFCAEKGLPTPRMWKSAAADMRDFLIKYDLSSSGAGMRGPFASYRGTDGVQALQPGGYYEQFVRGDMVKGWFWEDRLVGLQIHPMPGIVGNGVSTVRELLTRAGRPDGERPLDWSKYEDIARFQDTSLEAKLPAGQPLLADFRYTSPLLHGFFNGTPTLERYKDSPVPSQLARFGPMVWNGIPEDVRPATLYTLDAIADADGKVWLLEMNCNPAVHPEAYPFILETLFGPPSARQSALDAPPVPHRALPLQSSSRPADQALALRPLPQPPQVPAAGEFRFRTGVS